MDWKKFAAQTLSDNDVEKAFLDQAYMLIQNKANPLMRPPHRLGFEIVYKNDANTKMVGIFVFRIGRELYYAPVFFMNGNIKGTDLFYRHTTKTFVPLTNEWVDYLMHLSQTPEGEPIDRAVRQEAHNSMDLLPLINPPQMRKMASEAWNEMVTKAEALTKSASNESVSILRRFITEDGGHDAIRKIGAAAKLDYAFANALFMCSEPENYAPELADNIKSAGEVKPALVLHLDPVNNTNVKSASVADIAKGYQIEDNRKEAAISLVYEPLEATLEGVDGPGIYDVLMADGARRELLVAHEDQDMLNECPLRDPNDNWHYATGGEVSGGNNLHRRYMCVDLENKESDRSPYNHEIYGEFTADLDEKAKGVSKEVSSDSAYRLLNLDKQSLSNPFLVKNVGKTDAGLTKFEAVTGGYSDRENPMLLIHNPDYDGPLDKDGVIGKGYAFVPVKHETKETRTSFPGNIKFGERAALDAFIYGGDFKRASVVRLTQDEFALRRHETEKLTPGMSKLGAKLALMNECNLRETDADQVLADTIDKGCFEFLYQSHQVKSALQHPRMPQFPEFYNDIDGDFNVPYEDQNAQRTYVMADGEQPIIQYHRIGDALHHSQKNQDRSEQEMANTSNPQELSPDQIDTATPQSLFQLSQQKGLGSLFEHGVVGSLVKTYDSIALVEKYLPDLEQALDRVGRILFLLYWKPEDFSESYGTDDQNELENQLLSNFKSWGDMVLNFLLKNEKVQKGNTPLQ